MRTFITELRRRRVFRVVAAYLAASFIVLQAADLLVEPLRAPVWTMTAVVLLLTLGLPVVVFLAWAFQVTPEGIERDPSTAAPAAAGSAQSVAPPAGGPLRMAVLPFTLLREDPEIDFLGFAIADALAGSLAGIRTLQVRSPLRAGKALGEQNPEAVAAQLAVDALLCGTILRVGDEVRIQAQLVNAQDGAILWSLTLQHAMDELVTVHDQLSERIVQSLGVSLSPRERVRLRNHAPATPRAYELYLRANHLSLLHARWAEARDLYKMCLAEDPAFAPAWARLGRSYRLLAKYLAADEPAEPNLELATRAFEEALRLDPDLPIAHHLYAQLEVELGRPLDAAARVLARLALGVSDSELFAGLVHACRYCGLLTQSLIAHERARELDPHVATSVAHTYFLAGRYEEAIASCETGDVYLLCTAHVMLGHEAEALRIGIENLVRPEDWAQRPFLASLMRLLQGQRTESLKHLANIGYQRADAEVRYYIARHLARLGDDEQAVRSIVSAVERGFYALEACETDPWLDSIRARPDFVSARNAAAHNRRIAQQALSTAGLDQVLGMTVARH